MRTLAVARILSTRGDGLPLEDLAGIVGAEPVQLAHVVEQLCDEGAAELCADAAALRLTERMAQELLRGQQREASPMRRVRVAEAIDAAP
jgi:hypothetical protein